jgi:drug/metabolite transporter (DMT)-like permease
VHPTPLFWGVTLLQAAGALIGVGLLTRAYQIGETSYIAVFEYSFLISASFWGWVIWGDVLGGWSFVGLGLIIVSGGVIAVRSAPAASG